MAASGTSFGQQLDLKPFGPMPAPWPLARCPSNGFVLYKEEFSADEIERLKPYVLSPEYQALRKDNSDYYLAAQLLQFMGADADEVAWSLLQATWEMEADATRYRRYAQEALAKFSVSLTKPQADRQKWATMQLIAGELERRLGRFEDARERFSELGAEDEFHTGVLAEILAYQLQLVDASDTQPHPIPEKRE
jgi:hypothetical protein